MFLETDHLLTIFSDPVYLYDPLEPDTPPPVFLEGPEEITVQEGDRAVLPCRVKDLGTKQVNMLQHETVYVHTFIFSYLCKGYREGEKKKREK